MLTVYVPRGRGIERQIVEDDQIPQDGIWIDLREPSPEEIRHVEAFCGVDLPTHEDMVEIEISSRLYSEDGADFMTANIISGFHQRKTSFVPVTFCLVGGRLVTVRYADQKTFQIYGEKLCRRPNGSADENDAHSEVKTVAGKPPTGHQIAVGILETVVDRLADLLEYVSADLEAIGDDVFRSSEREDPLRTSDFKSLLKRIGSAGELTSGARDSLATFSRLIPFLQLSLDRGKPGQETRSRVKVLGRDVASLIDFASFLANKTTFLLDTTVGMISIEQSGIIKIFSVVAVAFLPPTLVASIYGMNFEYMPELSWRYGYAYALGMIVISAILPMAFFRWMKWL